MPNRVLRDWTDSATIQKLSIEAELFFVRLMMKADDYGCYYSNTHLLLVNLFPWKIKEYTEDDVKCWLKECVDAGIITTYEAEGKECLIIHKFNQTLRQKNRKFPPPPDTSNTSAKQATNRGKASANKKKDVAPTAPPRDKLFGTEYDELMEWMDEFAPLVKKMKYPLTEQQYEKLREQYSVENIEELLLAIGNNKNVEKYTNTYSTFVQWAKNQKWKSEINNIYANNKQHIQEEAPTNKWFERQISGNR